MAREPTASADDEAQPGWRVKDGQVLTKGEKVVLETVRSLWPNGDYSGRRINEKIKEALPKGDDGVSLTTIKSARSKIYFAG